MKIQTFTRFYPEDHKSRQQKSGYKRTFCMCRLRNPIVKGICTVCNKKVDMYNYCRRKIRS